MTMIAIKAVSVWLLMVLAALINGVFRERVFWPLLGIQIALPLNGVFLCALASAIMFLFIPFIGKLHGSLRTY
jgi:hypothetical protein